VVAYYDGLCYLLAYSKSMVGGCLIQKPCSFLCVDLYQLWKIWHYVFHNHNLVLLTSNKFHLGEP